MRKVQMIRSEPGLIAIPLERAMYCENCATVSTSNGCRCGVCGSEEIAELALLLFGPPNPMPPPAAAGLVQLAA